MTFTLIETKTLASAAASIEFTSIPQDGTDLLVLGGLRNTVDTAAGTIAFNTGGTYTRRRLLGNGSSASSDTPTSDFLNTTDIQFGAGNFSNIAIYIPNYTGSTAKSYSSDSVTENNSTLSFQALIAGLWSGTTAITTVTFTPLSGGNWTIGSTISLYKITKGSSGVVVS